MIDDAEIRVLAAANNLEIAPEQMSGVRDNLALLRHYAALIEALDLPERMEPAFEYEP